jgi:hypothetical protein
MTRSFQHVGNCRNHTQVDDCNGSIPVLSGRFERVTGFGRAGMLSQRPRRARFGRTANDRNRLEAVNDAQNDPRLTHAFALAFRPFVSGRPPGFANNHKQASGKSLKSNVL